MRLPWDTPPAPPSPITAELLERARQARERADAVITLLLPAIDPNDLFAPPEPEPAPAEEGPAWSD